MEKSDNSPGGNIKVVCRFRPQNKREIDLKDKVCIKFLNKQTVKVVASKGDQKGD